LSTETGQVHSSLKEARVAGFRFHDIRHTFASYLAMSGATLAELAEALGHKTLAMVKRYAHLSEEHTSAVVGRYVEKFLP
jgi:integrase